VSALLQHVGLILRLHGRNRMALVYGHLFPLLFLVVFAVLYRHESVPLIAHLGEWLTISVLGGACFGLPTTLVSERELGVWRRYRLVPVAPGVLIAGAVLARYLLILSAGGLQLALALVLGMPLPADLPGLVLAFTAVAFAFIGLGLVLAALADTVPAVQALGQCLFLPLLVIGGVAVPLAALPDWAQHTAAFLPGRYAVAALQAGAVEPGGGAAFDLLALLVTGAAGCVVGLRLFRWEAGGGARLGGGRAWLVLVVAAWAAIGITAVRQDRSLVRGPVPVPEVPAAPTEPWRAVDLTAPEEVTYATPSDFGVVTPFAPPDEEMDPAEARLMAGLGARLRTWPPAQDADPVQRVRNLLSVAAQVDIAQLPYERHVPRVLLGHLVDTLPADDLARALVWIIRHPEEGAVVADLTGLGLGWYGADEALIRVRSRLYAVKFLQRVAGGVPW